MANFSKHVTLAAGTVQTVTLTVTQGGIEVINRTGTAEIYFTIGANGATPPTPTIGGDDTYVVPATVGSYVANLPEFGVPCNVSLISSAAGSASVVSGGAE